MKKIRKNRIKDWPNDGKAQIAKMKNKRVKNRKNK